MSGSLLSNVAHMTAAAVLGAMVFFSAVVAPLVFIRLPGDQAGAFIRSLFPHYYLSLGLACFLALALALLSGHWGILPLVALGSVCLGFALARQWMMPKINRFRDASLDGELGAERGFKTWHLASVCLNAAQMLVLVAICLSVYPP